MESARSSAPSILGKGDAGCGVGSSRIKLGSATGIMGPTGSGGGGEPSCSDVLAAGFLRAGVFFRVVAFLAAGFLRAAVFFPVVAFLAAGFLRAAVFFRVVAFLAAGFLRAAVFFRAATFVAAVFFRPAGLRTATVFVQAAVFLRVALLVRAVALLLLAGIAVTFLIVGNNPMHTIETR